MNYSNQGFSESLQVKQEFFQLDLNFLLSRHNLRESKIDLAGFLILVELKIF